MMTTLSSHLARLALLGGTLIATSAFAQPHALDAAASDPRTMGWMTGFPTAADRVIAPPASDYLSFPKLRWTFCHLREMQASRRVSRGPGPSSAMTSAPDSAIDSLSFTPIGKDSDMTWRESLDANYTDGILIMHKGVIVYE